MKMSADQVAVPRPAATVVLVRPGRQVLLIQRNREMSFFGGAFAFPGGRVDATDVGTPAAGNPWQGHQAPVAGQALTPNMALLHGAYRRAAVREVAEETGIALAAEALVPWARWITPEVEPKRYDTLFFLAPVPDDTVVTIDGGETVAHRWLTPEAALAACAAGELLLPPPTQVTLAELAAHSERHAWLDAAATVPEIMPLLQSEGEALWLVLPGDALHPAAPLRAWPAGMPTRARLGEGPPAFTARS